MARARRWWWLCSRLAQKPDLNVKFGAKSESALHVAAAQGAEAVATVLAGADPNLRDGGERSPLHVAAAAGHHVIMEKLLLSRVIPDPKIRDDEQTPPSRCEGRPCALCVESLGRRCRQRLP
ncbi:unnamed protein product [Pylaiella littoralis]